MTVLPPSDEPFDRPPPSGGAGLPPEEPEIGAFRRGTGLSRVALGRYLVARAVAQAIDLSMYAIALTLVLISVLIFAFWIKWIAVLLFIAALVVLAFRALFMALLRRLAGPLGAAEEKIRDLVSDSRGDLRRELKRIGLPGSTFGLPLVAFRLIGRRRAKTLEQMRQFDVARVVPEARLDHLHLIIENDVFGGRDGPR
ncbi:MAG: hypothetical protein ACR2KJ_18360 [Jatrophihabitans sp.]